MKKTIIVNKNEFFVFTNFQGYHKNKLINIEQIEIFTMHELSSLIYLFSTMDATASITRFHLKALGDAILRDVQEIMRTSVEKI